MSKQLAFFDIQQDFKPNQRVVNVASVPQRSPFRYPGGKTWLIPTVRKWLKAQNVENPHLIEPFVGGGIVSLTAAFENLVSSVTMVEKDEEVAAVWETIMSQDNKWLATKILNFDLSVENAQSEFLRTNKHCRDVAFCTILKNRIFHGGIIAKGSGLLKNGENGRGIASRWYPKTLHDRIRDIEMVQSKISFVNGDAFDVIEKHMNDVNAIFFIDPPYVVAGKRLYTYYQVDHDRLFDLTSKVKGRYLLTYDDAPEIRLLAEKYHLRYKEIPMKTTHHLEKSELLISNQFDW